MKSIIAFLSSLLSFLPDFLFGVSARGEKLKPPTFTTVNPEDKVEFNKWAFYVHHARD